MAKKRKPHTFSYSASRGSEEDRPATLKEMLNPDILQKLKAQSDELKAAEEKLKAEQRKQAEEARRAEQKRLENDFEYLLKKSDPNWRKYK